MRGVRSLVTTLPLHVPLLDPCTDRHIAYPNLTRSPCRVVFHSRDASVSSTPSATSLPMRQSVSDRRGGCDKRSSGMKSKREGANEAEEEKEGERKIREGGRREGEREKGKGGRRGEERE